MSRTPFFLFCAILSSSASAALSTFDSNRDGWLLADYSFATKTADIFDLTDPFDPQPIFTANDGKPAGSIYTGDEAAWCFFVAPAEFLGDQSATFGSNLTYDTYVTQSDGLPYASVILQGSGVTLYNVTAPPGTGWTTFSIPLLGSSWSLSEVVGSPSVTDADLQAVMGGLTGLFINADWLTSPMETTGLDNVSLQVAPVPEPATLAALGLGSVAAMRRRRKKG